MPREKECIICREEEDEENFSICLHCGEYYHFDCSVCDDIYFCSNDCRDVYEKFLSDK